jgi:hypothetical protein
MRLSLGLKFQSICFLTLPARFTHTILLVLCSSHRVTCLDLVECVMNVFVQSVHGTVKRHDMTVCLLGIQTRISLDSGVIMLLVFSFFSLSSMTMLYIRVLLFTGFRLWETHLAIKLVCGLLNPIIIGVNPFLK